jgi:hypothetical protein
VSDQVRLTIEKTDDPWIDAYLAFRGAVLDGELKTVADVEEYAHEAQRGLPAGGPSIPAAMFITADVAVTFAGESFPVLMTALWTPHEARGRES